MKRIFLVVCALLAMMAQVALAAEFTKNVKIIIPFAPGGGLDLAVRMMSDLGPKYLNGKQLLVENLPGGSAVVGLTAASKAKPDGYTLAAVSPLYITNVLTKEVSYKIESFVPVALFSLDPVVLVAKKDSPYKKLEDVIAAGKTKPLNINTTGHFSVNHIGGMIVEKYLGIKINYVHANSGGMQLTQLLGGHVEASLVTLGEVSTYLKDGSIRCLGIMSEKKFPGLPPMQSFSSVGLLMDGKPVEWGSMRGFMAVAGTPKPMLDALEKAFLGMINDPVYAERMVKADYPRTAMGSKEFQAFLKDYEKILRDMLAEVGVEQKK